jgi:hypothetical protein
MKTASDMQASNNYCLNLSDEVVLAMLREAVEEVCLTIDRSRALIRETYALLNIAERLQMPLTESR